MKKFFKKLLQFFGFKKKEKHVQSQEHCEHCEELKHEEKKEQTLTWENPMPFVEKKTPESVPETSTPDVGLGVEVVEIQDGVQIKPEHKSE
jgi:hypothetical protein